MIDNHQTMVYQRIKNLIDHLGYTLIDGIGLEINAFFLNNPLISSINLSIDDNIYKISVTLKEWTIANVHSLFQSFFRFITYRMSGFFASVETETGITYLLASYSGSTTGFFCELEFERR